jgi:hypothetical protein
VAWSETPTDGTSDIVAVFHDAVLWFVFFEYLPVLKDTTFSVPCLSSYSGDFAASLGVFWAMVSDAIHWI